MPLIENTPAGIMTALDLAQALHGCDHGMNSGEVWCVRIYKSDSGFRWLKRSVKSKRWSLASRNEAATFATEASAKKTYAKLPRVAAKLEAKGWEAEVVRLNYEITIKLKERVVVPAPRRKYSLCVCCGKSSKIYKLRWADLCEHCYEESCDTHDLPCLRKKEETARNIREGKGVLTPQ